MTTPTHAPEASPPALQAAWQNVIVQLKAQLDAPLFNAYIRDCQPVGLDGDVLTIAAPSEYARDWSNSRLGRTISRQMTPLFGRPVQVRFVYPGPAQPEPVGQGQAQDAPAETGQAASAPAPVGPAGGNGRAAALTADPTGAGANADDDAGVDACSAILLESAADSIEAALQRPGRIVAFPRYELRFIPLVGPQNFFLRLAFLQERFFHTSEDGRGQSFETSVEALLRWANVGRATLHRFKKGDAARGQPPAAGWFGIEQLPSAPRSAATQQQPPCRYRVQLGIPLTPMDADRLGEQLAQAGIRQDPVQALQSLCERPLQEILVFPPPAPNAEQRGRAPGFTTVTQVVLSALGSRRIDPEQRAKINELTARLNDHITLPQQMVHLSWYFLREWLPLLGHDAAALVLYARAQGYYNPQTQELRDEISVSGGYGELARVIGLKRDRTIGDWLPNIFESRPRQPAGPEPAGGEDKWQREQQRQQQLQARIAQFVQVAPGSRAKTASGHYAFKLNVELKGDPLTPGDRCLRDWVTRTLAACAEADVLAHFLAWVKSEAFQRRALAAAENDGAGTLGAGRVDFQNDGWGILAARREQPPNGEMTARESDVLESDGWGILEKILNDGWGILAPAEMTARELFKGLMRLNTYWETIPDRLKTTPETGAPNPVVVEAWDLQAICRRNGGMNRYREQIIAENAAAPRFISWLLYAYSFKGRGIHDPVGWALARLKEQPDEPAEGVYQRLAGQPPQQIGKLLHRQIETGLAPADGDWSLAFRDTPLPRLRELAEILGLNGTAG